MDDLKKFFAPYGKVLQITMRRVTAADRVFKVRPNFMKRAYPHHRHGESGIVIG